MPLRIAQISDTHLSVDFPNRTTDLQNAVDAINQLNPPADVVIHTGDIADNGLSEQYALAKSALDTLKNPCYLLAGNRDDRQQMKNAFPGNPSFADESPFIQYAIESFDTRLIILDTLCVGSNKGQLCSERLAGFEQMLNTNKTKPAAVLLHHAPFEATEIPDPMQFVDWRDVDAFSDIVNANPQIREIFCGHLHRNIEARVGTVPASSISCMAGDLRRGDVSDQDRQKLMFRVITLA